MVVFCFLGSFTHSPFPIKIKISKDQLISMISKDNQRYIQKVRKNRNTDSCFLNCIKSIVRKRSHVDNYSLFVSVYKSRILQLTFYVYYQEILNNYVSDFFRRKKYKQILTYGVQTLKPKLLLHYVSTLNSIVSWYWLYPEVYY